MTEPDNTFGVFGIGVLNRKPLLVHIFFGQVSPFPFIEALSRGLDTTRALIFVSNAWSMLSRWKNDCGFQSYLQDYRAHRRRYPNHRVVLMANDAMEREFLHAHGIEVVLFQHNGFLHAYDQPRVAAKEFDAVYIARIHPDKRVELARDIPSCCIVFRRVETDYFQQIRPLVSHFVFANGDPLSSESRRLPRAQVADWCARSRTGLCLSAEEGAMFASAEYMLWGLPVVSTDSLGGRDEYFDDRFCLICEDNPASVATAVKEAISRNLEPNLIRNTFLGKVMERRVSLLRFIIGRTEAWGGTLERFTRDWLNISTPFLDDTESLGLRGFTAPQLLKELDSLRLSDGPRWETFACKAEEPPDGPCSGAYGEFELKNEFTAMLERVFPHTHIARPLVVSFYGDGEQWLGHALVDFFDNFANAQPRTELCRIMTEEGSDKGSGWHNYTRLYHFLFRHRRYEITSLFEVGIGTDSPNAPSSMGPEGIPGASLRGWKRYFPRAQIFGGDIDTRIIFSEERISTFYVDQLRDDSVQNLWRNLPDERFDVIIDDGLHNFDANTTFFRNSIKKLKENGYYIIEDITIDQENVNKLHEFFSNRTESGVILRIPNEQNNYDNCLGIFRRASAQTYKDEGSSNDREAALARAVEHANLENETLRAEVANLRSTVSQEVASRDAVTRERDTAIAVMNQSMSERDALAAESMRWFEAVTAVRPDHNPLVRVPRRQHRLWRTFSRYLNSRHRRPSPRALADRARDAGRWELAVRYYRDALDVHADDPEIWMQCGLALGKAGKTSEAEVAFQRLRQLHPGSI